MRSLLHHFLDALDGVKGAFFFATTVGIGDKAAVPPAALHFVEEMMNDTINKRCGKNFANHWVVNDERDRAAGGIAAFENGVGEMEDVFGPIFVVTVFIESFELVFASFLEGNSESFDEPVAHAVELDVSNNELDINGFHYARLSERWFLIDFRCDHEQEKRCC